jgi:hypothetical protein
MILEYLPGGNLRNQIEDPFNYLKYVKKFNQYFSSEYNKWIYQPNRFSNFREHFQSHIEKMDQAVSTLPLPYCSTLKEDCNQWVRMIEQHWYLQKSDSFKTPEKYEKIVKKKKKKFFLFIFFFFFLKMIKKQYFIFIFNFNF